MDKLDKKDKIILKILGLLSFLPLLELMLPENNFSMICTVFIPSAAISYSVHGTPLAIRLRKFKFSMIWFLGTLILIVDYFLILNDLSFTKSFLLILCIPFLSFILYQILRMIFISILKREPITLWVAGYSSEKDFVIELKRRADNFDLIFTLISLSLYFGLFSLIGNFING